MTHPDLVCDDFFGALEAQSACYTLGYTNGGSFQPSYDISNQWSENEIPILMDNVDCGSASNFFLSCSRTDYNSYYSDEYNDNYDPFDGHDCYHGENVLLTCLESGYLKSYFFTIKYRNGGTKQSVLVTRI